MYVANSKAFTLYDPNHKKSEKNKTMEKVKGY